MLATSLNPQARLFREAFCRRFPQWSDAVYPYDKWCAPGDPTDEIMFCVFSPDADRRLDAWSWNGSLRVRFGELSMRWSPAAHGEQPEATIETAIRFVEQIVDESMIAVYRKTFLSWLDPKLYKVVAVPVLAGRFDEGRGFLASRSWRRTYDRGAVVARAPRRPR